MNMKLKSLRTSATLIVLLAVSLLTFSCNSFDERLPECRLLVKFKYDYNMLHTDAFHTQVDRVELYIFDKDGRYLFSQVEEGEVFGYRILYYGGKTSGRRIPVAGLGRGT